MSNFIIHNNSTKCLKLNEAETTKEQYILQGVFAQFDVENRNGRIYTKEEYLPHLEYLRADIKKGEPLLGELDHPEDRFEVSLANVSHQVLDLWLDEANNCVMGKIKLLDTPAGKIAKALIDDGVPLHISSRAAGSVDSRTHKVSIQQIFTYDAVAKPGFANAVLNRVNESQSTKSYSDDTMNFLKSSLAIDAKNQAPQYNILNENVAIREVFGNVELREEAKNIDINNKINIEDMTNQLYENEVGQPLQASEDAAAAMGIEMPDMTLAATVTDESKSSEEHEVSADDNKETKEKLILEIKPVYKEEEKQILEIKPIYKDTEKAEDSTEDDEKSEDAEKTEETDKTEETNECDTKGDDKVEVEKTPSNTLNDELDEKKKQLEASKAKLSKIDDLINNLKKKKDIKESEFAEYPFTKEMSESAYKQFNNLNYEQKDKVANYLVENMIVGADNINRLWENALIDNSVEEPIWLSRASNEYRDLYEKCSEQEKENLANCAKYLIFESQYDVDVFWANSLLKEKSERQKLNEHYNNIMPKIETVKTEELPYSLDFVNEIEKQTIAFGK